MECSSTWCNFEYYGCCWKKKFDDNYRKTYVKNVFTKQCSFWSVCDCKIPLKCQVSFLTGSITVNGRFHSYYWFMYVHWILLLQIKWKYSEIFFFIKIKQIFHNHFFPLPLWNASIYFNWSVHFHTLNAPIVCCVFKYLLVQTGWSI